MGLDDAKQIVSKGYDAIADTYLQRFGFPAAKDRWGAELAARVAPAGDVLDLGCGAGIPLAKALAERGFSVVGVDISPRQVKLAERNVPSAKFMVGDLASLQLATDSFDGVAAFYSFNHVPRDEYAEAFISVARWLRPGGVFVGNFGVNNDPAWFGQWLGAETFFSSFDSATTERLIGDTGLRIEMAVIEGAEDEDAQFLWIVATKGV